MLKDARQLTNALQEAAIGEIDLLIAICMFLLMSVQVLSHLCPSL
jgi:hypothetical protein